MTRMFQGLTVCSPSADRLDIFARAEGGELWHRSLVGGGWSAWESLGGQGTSAPAVTVSGPGRMELFAIGSRLIGSEYELLHRRFDATWSPWLSHGRLLALEPKDVMLAVVATGSDRFEVIFTSPAPQSALFHFRLGAQPPQPPAVIQTPILGCTQIEAVSPAPGVVDLFVRVIGRTRVLWRKRFDGNWLATQPIEDPPGALNRERDGIAATAGLDFFTVGSDTQLWHRRFTDAQPRWEPLGGQLGRDLTAVSRGSRIDLFAIWAGVALMHRWFDGAWSNWTVVDIWPRPTTGYNVLRPQDLVALDVRGVGLRERVQSDGTPELVPEQAGARLIVGFPPQHVGEAVVPLRATSSDARLAGPSRLAFSVGSSQSVTLSVPGVLDAMTRLHLLQAPPPVFEPPMPGPNETAIELPWRLLISPTEPTRLSHRSLPGASDEGVTELWHSRLTGSDGGRLDVRPLVGLPHDVLDTPLGTWVDYIGRIGSRPDSMPVVVERLILSALGGWLSASGSWPWANLEWSHEAAMGRDFNVRVLKRGMLFPFGHRAVYFDLSERRFDQSPPSVAALRRNRFLIVTEPEREYGIGAGGPHEREFPFQHVTIEPRLVTPLDEPAWLPGRSFWPSRGSAPIMFSVRARAGQEVVELTLPLLFADDDVAIGAASAEDLNAVYAAGRPTALVGRQIPLAMRSATAPLPGAIQEVHSLTFGGVRVARSISSAGFHPQVTQLEVALPAVRQLLGPTPPLPATFSSALIHAAPGAEPDVLLDLKSSKLLDFAAAAQRTGALAAPNFNVTRISRELGPIAANIVDPSQLFDSNATLLGIVKLSDLISSISGPPKVTWADAVGAAAPAATFEWKQSLDNTRGVGPFIPGAHSSIALNVASTIVGGQPDLTTTGVLKDFQLLLKDLVKLEFEELRFTARPGQRPSITFDLKVAELLGALQFVKKVQQLIPTMGRGGPRIEVSLKEIKATYRTSIPTLALGALSVQNLVLDTGLTLALEQNPVVVDFAFGTRERPFLVTVSMFGGGGYLELGLNAQGLQRFVGGIEFGASVAMDFVVARGEVHVFGGIVFAMQGRAVQITGYLRIGGSVEVLGLIKISVELTVSLTYVLGENALIGSARLVITVDLTLWSTSVELECHQRFDGSSLSIAPDDNDFFEPQIDRRASSVTAALEPRGESRPWETYCRAFAVE